MDSSPHCSAAILSIRVSPFAISDYLAPTAIKIIPHRVPADSTCCSTVIMLLQQMELIIAGFVNSLVIAAATVVVAAAIIVVKSTTKTTQSALVSTMITSKSSRFPHLSCFVTRYCYCCSAFDSIATRATMSIGYSVGCSSIHSRNQRLRSSILQVHRNYPYCQHWGLC